MSDRLAVTKTYKLFIKGGFPRSESGRSLPVKDGRGEVITHIAHGSRKDLRDAVEAARGALDGWASRTAYNRGQILYRLAEMLEGHADAFSDAIRVTARPGTITAAAATREVSASIDRLVSFAGWADKFSHVLGCANPVDAPYYNFTSPEPTGVIGLAPPDQPALLGLVSLLAPALCAGNTVVVVANTKHPLPAAILGEVCATSDVPPGVINILTTPRGEIIDHLAQHRGIDAIGAINPTKADATTVRLGAAQNVKRVHVESVKPADAWYDTERMESPWSIHPFVEMKTIWHPASAK